MPRNNNFLALGKAREVAFSARIKAIWQEREGNFFTVSRVRFSRSDYFLDFAQERIAKKSGRQSGLVGADFGPDSFSQSVGL
jgi:hypothetical protein